MFFCGLLLLIKSRPKLIQKEPFGGYIGGPTPDHPAQWQLPTPKKNNFNPQKNDRALAAPRSWPRHGRVQSRGSTAHDHATRFEYLATCEQQVIGACCMFAIAAAAMTVASACVCAAACCRGHSQAGVGFEPPLAIPRTGRVAVAKPSHFSLALPCCPAHRVS